MNLFNFFTFFDIPSPNQLYVNSLNLYEIKREILLNYKADFGLNGSMVMGPVEHKTKIGFKNLEDFEGFINAIDIDYDNEDVTFTGWI